MEKSCSLSASVAAIIILGLTFLISPAAAVTVPSDVSALQDLFKNLSYPPQLVGWKSNGGDPCGESWAGLNIRNNTFSGENMGSPMAELKAKIWIVSAIGVAVVVTCVVIVIVCIRRSRPKDLHEPLLPISRKKGLEDTRIKEGKEQKVAELQGADVEEARGQAAANALTIKENKLIHIQPTALADAGRVIPRDATTVERKSVVISRLPDTEGFERELNAPISLTGHELHTTGDGRCGIHAIVQDLCLHGIVEESDKEITFASLLSSLDTKIYHADDDLGKLMASNGFNLHCISPDLKEVRSWLNPEPRHNTYVVRRANPDHFTTFIPDAGGAMNFENFRWLNMTKDEDIEKIASDQDRGPAFGESVEAMEKEATVSPDVADSCHLFVPDEQISAAVDRRVAIEVSSIDLLNKVMGYKWKPNHNVQAHELSQENDKEGKILNDTISLKSTNSGGSNPLSTPVASPVPVTQVVNSGEKQAEGFSEGSNVLSSVGTTIQASSPPDLKSLSPSDTSRPQPFTDLQKIQLHAQIVVFGSFIQGAAQDVACLLAAIGEFGGGRSVWETVQHLALERLCTQNSTLSNSGATMDANPSGQSTKRASTLLTTPQSTMAVRNGESSSPKTYEMPHPKRKKVFLVLRAHFPGYLTLFTILFTLTLPCKEKWMFVFFMVICGFFFIWMGCDACEDIEDIKECEEEPNGNLRKWPKSLLFGNKVRGADLESARPLLDNKDNKRRCCKCSPKTKVAILTIFSVMFIFILAVHMFLKVCTTVAFS